MSVNKKTLFPNWIIFPKSYYSSMITDKQTQIHFISPSFVCVVVYFFLLCVSVFSVRGICMWKHTQLPLAIQWGSEIRTYSNFESLEHLISSNGSDFELFWLVKTNFCHQCLQFYWRKQWVLVSNTNTDWEHPLSLCF